MNSTLYGYFRWNRHLGKQSGKPLRPRRRLHDRQLGLSCTGLDAVLVEAIKELRAKNEGKMETLTQENTTLKEELANIMQENSAIKQELNALQQAVAKLQMVAGFDK